MGQSIRSSGHFEGSSVEDPWKDIQISAINSKHEGAGMRFICTDWMCSNAPWETILQDAIIRTY